MGLPSIRGPKELLERRQLQELMGMVVKTSHWAYQRRYQRRVHGALMINDPHTTFIIHQLHMPIVQNVNHLRGYLKPNRPGVGHLVPNAQLHNK